MDGLPPFADVRFSGHAIQRMFERSLSVEGVLAVLQTGRVIEGYPDDKPYPSWLVLGYHEGQPLHVVVAVDGGSGTAVVVTAYVPEPELWGEDFARRRQR
jgi:hypothetical protein